MSPTMTIPSTPLPARSGEARANEPGPGADNADGDDAFTHALQRARAEPKPARANAVHSPERKPGEPLARPARDAHADRAHGSEQKIADAGSAADAAAGGGLPGATSDEAASDDAAARCIASATDAALPGAAPAVTMAPTMTPHDVAADGATRLLPAEDPPLQGVDGRAPRALSRGGAHDARGLPMHARQASSDVAANRHDPATGAQLPRADFERANADVERPQPGGLRAPSFERLPLEGAALLTAGVPTREWNTASAGRAADTQLPQATLHAAIDEPGFGAAIGQQVALWVRDGAQEARLQLHPAELGPVTVQIALDGQAAHVDFTAAVAATRESIEESLPALAAALRESGFTLAGGSVSSDARQAASDGGRQRSGAGAGGRSQPDGTVEAATAPAPRRWTRSLVDVYA